MQTELRTYVTLVSQPASQPHGRTDGQAGRRTITIRPSSREKEITVFYSPRFHTGTNEVSRRHAGIRRDNR